MQTNLFLQSEVQNPYDLYAKMLVENPVNWDSLNNLWALYPYEDCVSVLKSSSTAIPLVSQQSLNEYALLITGKLARLTNEIQHEIAKHTVLLLFRNMKTISMNSVIRKLIDQYGNAREIDWVDVVSKKIPVSVVMKSFDFSEPDVNFMLDNIDDITKIMSPVKTAQQIESVNTLSREIYLLFEKHLTTRHFYKSLLYDISERYQLQKGELVSFAVSNLIGLIIQSYDAGRGLLSNSLLQIVSHSNQFMKDRPDKTFFEKSVIETLRFDPPVQHTRRFAAADILLGDQKIKKDQTILIMIAAANRDFKQFSHANDYDIDRSNNHTHITFGAGVHTCPANLFSLTLTTETLLFFFDRYKSIQLLEKNIQYEPTFNTRLPQHVYISLNN